MFSNEILRRQVQESSFKKANLIVGLEEGGWKRVAFYRNKSIWPPTKWYF
jgi:hypothetical protein